MSDGKRALDAHAYVDGCLSPAERAAFEAAMARDPRLRARVDAWRAQNEAMHVAFGAVVRPRAPLTRPSNENSPPPRRAAPRVRPAAAALAGLIFLALVALPLGGVGDFSPEIAARAQSALRAVASGSVPLDFASDDASAVAAWLAARRPGLAGAPLHAPGWTLQGVRLFPGLGDTAALVVFEDALGERAGLWLERNDARPEQPGAFESGADRIVVTGATGEFDFAAVGPRASGAAALAPKIRAQPPR